MNQTPRKQTIYVKFTQLPMVMLSNNLNIEVTHNEIINVSSQHELNELVQRGLDVRKLCGNISSALGSLSKRLNTHFNEIVITDIKVFPFYDDDKRQSYLRVSYRDYASDEFSEQLHHFIQLFIDTYTLQFNYLDDILKLKQHVVDYTFCGIDVSVKVYQGDPNDADNHLGGWRLALGDEMENVESDFPYVKSIRRNLSLGHDTGIKLLFQAEANYR